MYFFCVYSRTFFHSSYPSNLWPPKLFFFYRESSDDAYLYEYLQVSYFWTIINFVEQVEDRLLHLPVHQMRVFLP